VTAKIAAIQYLHPRHSSAPNVTSSTSLGASTGAPEAANDVEDPPAIDAHVRLASWLLYERQQGSSLWHKYCRLLPTQDALTDAGAFWSEAELEELQFDRLKVW
jgi:hypothetical protein